MRRARLGLCIGDREYGDRFTSCLMNHYRDQLELHMFSQKEALQENWKTLDALVLSDDLAGENRIKTARKNMTKQNWQPSTSSW